MYIWNISTIYIQQTFIFFKPFVVPRATINDKTPAFSTIHTRREKLVSFQPFALTLFLLGVGGGRLDPNPLFTFS